MKRKFITDLVFIQVLNLLIKGVWILFIDRAVQNFLPAEDYVDYFVALNYSIFFIILMDFGLNSFNNREVAADPTFQSRNFVSILTLKALLSVGTFALAIGLAGIIGFDRREIGLVAAMLCFQVIASFNLYLRSNISAHQKFKLDGVISVLDRFIVVMILALPFYLVPELLDRVDLGVFVGVQILAVAITFVIGLLINIRQLDKPDLSVHFRPLLELMKNALPFALLAALMSIYTRIDAVMLNQLSVVAEVDHYAMSYRLLEAGNMFTLLMAGMLLPMFSRMMKNNESLNWLVSAASRLILLPGIVAVALLMAWSDEFMVMLYPQKATAVTGLVFASLIPSFLGFGLIYIYGTLLTAAKDLRFLNVLAIVCTVLNIICNYFAIKWYGAQGAAIVTVITQFIFGIGCFLRSGSRFNIRFAPEKMIKTIVYVVLMGVVIFTLKQYFANQVVHTLIAMLTAFIILLASGLIKRNEVTRIFRKRGAEPL